jgi:hypothetical protein
MDIPKSLLVHFLQDELHLPEDVIPRVLQLCKQPNRLAIVLWQQRLVTLAQLDQVFCWLEPYSHQARFETSA